jgi:cell shape-determining protein MreC
VVEPSRADPGHLSLDFIHPERLLHKGQKVVTSGWRAGRIASGFPSGLPIGVVAGGSIKEQQASARRSIRAFADLPEIVLVQVLTGG